MNYLAHAYLSFNDPEVLTGNMISDFVKGKKRFGYSEEIQKGIMLHRDIDTFTDTHPSTKKAKEFFKKDVGLYAGAFVDVAYDHFLACDTKEFPQDALLNFSLFAYDTLDAHKNILPLNFAALLPYMRKDNWLYNYSNVHGIEKSFRGLAHRAKYLENSAPVFESFIKNVNALQDCYDVFFPELKQFAFNKFSS